MRGVSLVLCLVFLFAGNVFAQDSPKPHRDNFKMGIEFKFLDVTAGFDPIKSVENVPASVRQVPSHPDDTWIYGNKQFIRTIPFDSVEEGGWASYNFGASPELTLWRFHVRGGIEYSFATFGQSAVKDNTGSTREINQYGEPVRGYGTSLVYYNIHGKRSWKPGLVTEVDLNFFKDFLIVAGAGRTVAKLVGESGYDRWDALEKYKDYDLGRVRAYKRYLGFGWQPEVDPDSEPGWRPIAFHLNLGKMRTEFDATSTGRGLTIKRGKPWFFDFGISLHL